MEQNPMRRRTGFRTRILGDVGKAKTEEHDTARRSDQNHVVATRGVLCSVGERMPAREYRVQLVIESCKKYKDYLEEIAFDWRGVSDNIAYHLAYMEYLYQLQESIPLEAYPVLQGLRIKTIITEIACCAEVLIYDAILNLEVTDKWNNESGFKLKPYVGFTVMLEYALHHKIIDGQLKGRLHQLFDLRHMIHLTHKKRDPFEFTANLLRDSEATLEALFTHFLERRRRGLDNRPINAAEIPLPWK
jgi:hypothetical protein